MIIKATAVVALACFAATCAIAGEIAEEALQLVEGADYRGVGFSSSPQDMQKLLPDAVLNTLHPGYEQAVYTYEVREDADHDCVLLRFVDDVLIEIDFIYFPKRVAAKGGAEALKAQAIKTLGESATSTDQTLLWDFPNLNRMIVAFNVNGKWSLHVYDRARRMALRDYKDTTVAANEPAIQVTVGPAVPDQPPGKLKNAIPSPVMEVIQGNALTDHPTSLVTQDYVVGKQVRAYQELENYRCPPGMRPRVFEYLVGRIKRDHPDDYSTQLYALDRQVAAFDELRSMGTPAGMASSHFFALRKHAAQRHSYDYSTQLYVLQWNVDEYLKYRTVGNSGDAIVRYLLKE